MRTPARSRRIAVAAVAALALVAALSSCSRSSGEDRTRVRLSETPTPAQEVRIGYFPNVTHATALIASRKNLFGKHLSGAKVVEQHFNSGPTEVNAFLGGSLDIGFIGSGPAINAYDTSKGAAVRMIAGAASGGAQLVTRPGITKPEQLAGATITTPQLGNTQDIALKTWLHEQGLPTGAGKRDVKVQNMENPRVLSSFREGKVDGGWLPEPWASRLVREGGGKVLVDERTLWPHGEFPTTVILVRKDFLREHPGTVRAVLRGVVEATDWARQHPEQAKTVTNAAIRDTLGKGLSRTALDRSFEMMKLSVDPVTTAFPRLAKDAVTAGVVDEPPNLTGFADFRMLNDVLESTNHPRIHSGPLAAK